MVSLPGTRGGHRSGFSLAEILVAVSITAILGGAILAVIPGAFESFAQCTSTVRHATAADDFDASFCRDFSSLVPEFGFDGDATSCAFWTVCQTGDDDFELRHVSYSIFESGIESRITAPAEYFLETGSNTFHAIPSPLPSWSHSGDRRQIAVTTSHFRYLSTNSTEAVREWHNPTNAPQGISTTLDALGNRKIKRTYARRTLP